MLSIASKPLEANAMRCIWRRIHPAATVALTALVGISAPAVVTASPQQAPNSRVVLDLPSGYVPSPLFSGFQNDTSGVSFIILEAPVGEYDKMAAGFTAEELAKRGITNVQKAELARNDPHVYMRAHQKSAAGAYAKFFVLFRTADQTILVSVNVPERSLERQAGRYRTRAGQCEDDRKTGRARPLCAHLSRAVQGGGDAGRHQQGLHARRTA
jgi:hypothetical protein